MKINTLRIKNFKIHKDIFINFQNNQNQNSSCKEFSDDCFSRNVIIGQNASGKTSILEAILMFSGADYFCLKSDKNKDLINSDIAASGHLENLAQIEIETSSLSKIKIEITPLRKHYYINSKKILSVKSFENLPAILSISPSLQYNFISTEGKRALFENLISNIDLGYLSIKSEYLKLCQKRMLFLLNNNYRLLDAIERQISELGIKMLLAREKTTIPILQDQLSFIRNESTLEAFGFKTGDAFDALQMQELSLEILKKNREVDLKTKRMFFSFSRFSFDILLHGKHYNSLSNSQQKLCIYEYIIASCEVIGSVKNKQIILLIDEIDAFFDRNKINFLLSRLKNQNIIQIISTSPSLNNRDIFSEFLLIDI